jgi:hypothetical protein
MFSLAVEQVSLKADCGGNYPLGSKSSQRKSAIQSRSSPGTNADIPDKKLAPSQARS